MNHYYENTYKKAELAKYTYCVYENIYEPQELRFNFLLSIFSTSVLGAALFAINPLLTLLTTYDAYLLTRYAFILNSTVFYLALHESKKHLTIGTLNFLGYVTHVDHRDKFERIALKEVKYTGQYENTFLNLEVTGLPPSWNRIRILKDLKS